MLAELNRRIDRGRGMSELADQVHHLRRRLANLTEQRPP
jgi:hypothetical protein